MCTFVQPRAQCHAWGQAGGISCLHTAVDGLGMCCCYCIPRFGSDGILVVSSLPAASLSLGCRGVAWKGQKVMKMVDGWPEVFGSPFGLLYGDGALTIPTISRSRRCLPRFALPSGCTYIMYLIASAYRLGSSQPLLASLRHLSVTCITCFCLLFCCPPGVVPCLLSQLFFSALHD